MIPRVLLVEPDDQLREQLYAEAASFGRVDDDADFETARTHLLSNRYDWVVTNLRLNAHNGLHLVHLAAAAGLRTRILVYADYEDATLAREVQQAGAFYEPRHEVQRTLPAYLGGSVRSQDRRDAAKRKGRQWRRPAKCRPSEDSVSKRLPLRNGSRVVD